MSCRPPLPALVKPFGCPMPFFRALPVRGDSFLLFSGSKSVLVDGGYKSTDLVTALGGAKHLDVVICTHNDLDHAGGLTDLLSQPGAPAIGEFWLPGRWSDHIEALITDPEGFVERLGAEIYELLADRTDFDPMTPYEDLILGDDGPAGPSETEEGERPAPDHEAVDPDPEWWRALADQIRQRHIAGPVWKTPPPPSHDARRQSLSDGQKSARSAVVAEAIQSAKRIREIALQAAHHSVPVRWFDFEAFANGAGPLGGWPTVLEPLNACELTTPPNPVRSSVAYYLALSQANRESLVFHAVETPAMPGVLFCGDSPLSGGRKTAWPGFRHASSRGFLATAPHHGRASNAGAYAIAEGWRPGAYIFWVKAGSSGPACRDLQTRDHVCTQCTGVPLRAVDFTPHFTPSRGWWSDLGFCWSSC